jgi:hypothetical protein
MKGFLLFVGIAFALVVGVARIGSLIHPSNTSGQTDIATGVVDSGPYRHKATSSISRASTFVGNFPTDQDRADYATGLAHIAHLHERLGGFTIFQVLSEGRAVREQADADRERQRLAAEGALQARQAAEVAATISTKTVSPPDGGEEDLYGSPTQACRYFELLAGGDTPSQAEAALGISLLDDGTKVEVLTTAESPTCGHLGPYLDRVRVPGTGATGYVEDAHLQD